MNYGTISGLDKKVSRLIFGCASLPQEASSVLDAALDNGINAFDTAHGYGSSEERLGQWVRRKNRDKIVVVTKGCSPTLLKPKRVMQKMLRQDLDTSLTRMKLDHVDVYLLHRDNPAIPAGEIVETLNELRREGKISVFGGSNWSAARLREANDYAKKHGLQGMTVNSPHYSLALQIKDPWGGNCTTLTGDDKEEDRKWCRRENIAIFAFSSLSRGLLSGKVSSSNPESAKKQMDFFAKRGYLYSENMERLKRAETLAKEKNCTVAQLALAWVFTQGLDMYAIFSTKKPARIADNAVSLDVKISAEEAAWLNCERNAL